VSLCPNQFLEEVLSHWSCFLHKAAVASPLDQQVRQCSFHLSLISFTNKAMLNQFSNKQSTKAIKQEFKKLYKYMTIANGKDKTSSGENG
jgi:hypothetical protein